MEETRRAETEQKVVEDKEGEGIWALVLATESVVTSFIKVCREGSDAAHC